MGKLWINPYQEELKNPLEDRTLVKQNINEINEINKLDNYKGSLFYR